MFLTGAPATMPDLSCYTTNLLAYLESDVPDVRRRLAQQVRLAVRVDAPDEELVFSHHPRIDRTEDGRELAYASAADWPTARAALLDALCRDARVLAVGNTRQLPWSPAYGQADAPHWLLIRDYGDGRWLVTDHFAALTPFGDQEPYLGRLHDAELARALALPSDQPREIARRDRLALGQEIPVPPARYRWLDWAPASAVPGTNPGPGSWSSALEGSLTRTATVLRTDPARLPSYVDDLWAAARHHTYQLAFAVAAGTVDPELAAKAAAAWADVPRTLRFAAQSAARGRPRPSAVDRCIELLIVAQRDVGTFREG